MRQAGVSAYGKEGTTGRRGQGIRALQWRTGQWIRDNLLHLFRPSTSPLVSLQTSALTIITLFPCGENAFYHKKRLYLRLLFRWYLCLTVASSSSHLSAVVSAPLAYTNGKEKTKFLLWLIVSNLQQNISNNILSWSGLMTFVQKAFTSS